MREARNRSGDGRGDLLLEQLREASRRAHQHRLDQAPSPPPEDEDEPDEKPLTRAQGDETVETFFEELREKLGDEGYGSGEEPAEDADAPPAAEAEDDAS